MKCKQVVLKQIISVGEETGFLVELQDKFGNLWSGLSTTKFLNIVTL
jgi:hypothetical protein